MVGYTLNLGDSGQALRWLPAGVARCCVTSPPYFGLRDYGNDAQIGLEETPAAYVEKLVAVFQQVWRVLADDGVLFLNLGDSYAGSGKGGQSEEKRSTNWQPVYGGKGKTYGLKPKDLIGIPWRVAFALQDDGWILRSDIIWHKPNPMPESVTDRPTRAHEYLFLLSKRPRYYYNAAAVREPAAKGHAGSNFHTGKTAIHQLGRSSVRPRVDNKTRNRRSVWRIATRPYKGAHFATMPPDLVRPCILAGSEPGDLVLDPFCGSGTVGAVATVEGRRFVGVDLNADYLAMAEQRIRQALARGAY